MRFVFFVVLFSVFAMGLANKSNDNGLLLMPMEISCSLKENGVGKIEMILCIEKNVSIVCFDVVGKISI